MDTYKQPAMGTLIERTTQYVIMVPLKAKDAVSGRKAYAKEIKTVPKEIATTLTYDQEQEMSDHNRLHFRPACRDTLPIREVPGNGRQTKIPMDSSVSMSPRARFPNCFNGRDTTGATSTEAATKKGN